MPRQKITEGIKIDAENLPDLTDNQMKFVEGVLAGKTASDAYRAAYDCSGSTNNTIWCEASKLNSNPKVSQWLAAARIAGLGSAVVTFEGHVRQLERIREVALKTGNVGAAVQAEQIRGKAAGLHVDQVRDVTDRHDAAQTIQQLAELTGADPHAIAAKYGVSLPVDAGATKH